MTSTMAMYADCCRPSRPTDPYEYHLVSLLSGTRAKLSSAESRFIASNPEWVSHSLHITKPSYIVSTHLDFTCRNTNFCRPITWPQNTNRHHSALARNTNPSASNWQLPPMSCFPSEELVQLSFWWQKHQLVTHLKW